jgi:hypothetical protein
MLVQMAVGPMALLHNPIPAFPEILSSAVRKVDFTPYLRIGRCDAMHMPRVAACRQNLMAPAQKPMEVGESLDNRCQRYVLWHCASTDQHDMMQDKRLVSRPTRALLSQQQDRGMICGLDTGK